MIFFGKRKNTYTFENIHCLGLMIKDFGIDFESEKHNESCVIANLGSSRPLFRNTLVY
jgi:hypothetical protein